MRQITVGHSPDADDIFMYYAIKFGWVGLANTNFKNYALDIETLNERALESIYDVSAISFGVYPLIADEYSLLRTAVSFGYGYGPKLIKLKGKKLKRNFKVALSGKHTTNALLFKLRYRDARIKYYNFLNIESAVLSGEVDAGVLIHESILDFSDKLEVEMEIFDIWRDSVKDDLPLPLGGMAIRRSIALLRAIELENTLIEAVKVANERKEELSQRLIDEKLVRVDANLLDKYLNMYANEDSASLNPKQIEALNRLFRIGFENGFYNTLIDTEEFLIPTEYQTLRTL
jgi:1,4-dihydroxy-6-naphthoate synthase